MTTIEFGRLTRSGETHHAQSWSVSLIFHVLGIWCALVLLAEIEKPDRPTPFTWEVAMVEAPPKAEPAPQPPTPPPPTPTPVRPRTMPQVQRTVDQRPPVQTQTVEAVRQTVQDVATPVEQVTATPVETAIHRPQVQSVESPTAVTQAVTTTTVATVVETSQAVSQVVTEAAPVTETAPVTKTAPVMETAPVTEQAVVAHQPTVMQRESVTQSDSPMVEQRPVQHRVVQYRQTQADYGWLRDTLWKRIQELKRYPALARSNHWEGKVVVAAVIREDGTVVGLRIAESSGRPILDQEALSVMRQASPLTLKHPLGKPQVTILVPISYRLDG